MQIVSVAIHNFRSIADAQFAMDDYTLLVGANNAGKSNIISALRVFYEDGLKWSQEDIPRVGAADEESWIQICCRVTNAEWKELPERDQHESHLLTLRKVLRSSVEPDRVKSNQSNLYAVNPDGSLDKNLWRGAKNVSQAGLGEVVYIPSLSVPSDQVKMSGPSPLRDMVNLILKPALQDSTAYKQLREALEGLEAEGSQDGGYLSEVTTPLNEALSDWGVSVTLTVGGLSAEDLTKNLIQHRLEDSEHSGQALSLERFGVGFQRALIYELLRLYARIRGSTASKKGIKPELTLLLFEEPEAFLHPHQQDTLARNLRLLGAEAGQQVLITTHSPVFVSRSSDDITAIVRVAKEKGASSLHQVDKQNLKDILHDGLALAACLQAYVSDPNVSTSDKSKANKMLANLPSSQIAEQEEALRLQLWLGPERAAMFFADHVVLVEGASEYALFEYLLSTHWADLRSKRLCIVQTLGKYNVHRFMALLERFGIRHGVLIDDDNGKAEHAAVNAMVISRQNAYTVAKPYLLPGDLEAFLGLPTPARDDRKPVEVLKAAMNKVISQAKLADLRAVFEHDLLGL